MRRRNLLGAAVGISLAGCLRSLEGQQPGTDGDDGEDTDSDDGTDSDGGSEGVSTVGESTEVVTVETVALDPIRDMDVALYGDVFSRNGAFFGTQEDRIRQLSSEGGLEWSSEQYDEGESPLLPEAVAFGEGRLYVGVTGEGRPKLYAFDRETGERLWTHQTDPNHRFLTGVVANGREVAYVSQTINADPEEVVFRGLDGSGGELWNVTRESEIPESLIRYDTRIHLATHRTQYSMEWGNPDSFGAILEGEEVGSQMLRDGGTIYAIDGGGTVATAFDPAEERINWRQELASEVQDVSSPGVGAELVVIGSKAGYVTALETTSGEVRWEARVGGPVDARRPVVTPGLVWVADRLGDVYGLASDTGEIVHQRTVHSDIESTPSVATADGRVIFDTDRTLYEVVTDPA